MIQTATLPLMLKQLRLSSIARHWQAFLGKAERNGWDSAQYLTALCEQELADRYSRRIARYGKESHLPVGKSLASFDFAQVPGLAREQIKALAGSSDTGPARRATSCCSVPAAWARPIWPPPSATD
jgi:DNA replication protein DnaC